MRQNIIFEAQKEEAEARPKELRVVPEPRRFHPEFRGQQEDEVVLYHAKPHKSMKLIKIGLIAAGGALLILLLQFFVTLVPSALGGLENMVSGVVILVLAIVVWWINATFDGTNIYITDRRVVKFQPVVPYRTTMRTLFWDEAIKVKSFYRNIVLEKILGIGTIEVHGRNHERDNVDADYLTYHEDLGNYIDKILYTYKNKPEDLKNFKKFIPKPAGRRD